MIKKREKRRGEEENESGKECGRKSEREGECVRANETRGLEREGRRNEKKVAIDSRRTRGREWW